MKEKIVGSTYKNIDLSKLTFTQKTKPKTIVDHDGSNVTIEVPTGIPECVVEGWIYPENTNQYDKDAKLIEVFTDEDNTTMPVGYLAKGSELYNKLKDITTPLLCKIKVKKFDTIDLNNSYTVIVD